MKLGNSYNKMKIFDDEMISQLHQLTFQTGECIHTWHMGRRTLPNVLSSCFAVDKYPLCASEKSKCLIQYCSPFVLNSFAVWITIDRKSNGISGNSSNILQASVDKATEGKCQDSDRNIFPSLAPVVHLLSVWVLTTFIIMMLLGFKGTTRAFSQYHSKWW